MAQSPNPGRTCTAPPLADTPKRASILKKLRSRPTVTGSAIALAVLIILVVFAPYFAPQNPTTSPTSRSWTAAWRRARR